MVATGNKIGMDATRDDTQGTPEHDEITIWLSKEENYLRIARAVAEKIKSEGIYDEIYNEYFDENKKEYVKINDVPISADILLEKPIYEGKFLVGILDAEIQFSFSGKLNKFDNKELNEVNLKHGFPVEEEHTTGITIISIPIEIKPKITSVGDTIRQINIYSKHFDRESLNSKLLGWNTGFILLTKEKLSQEMENLFKSQGIFPLSINQSNLKDYFLDFDLKAPTENNFE